jgi:hypothetical protein
VRLGRKADHLGFTTFHNGTHMLGPDGKRRLSLAVVRTAIVDTSDAGFVATDVVQRGFDDVR